MYTDASHCINMKRLRQSAILDLVAREAIGSQDRLRQRLRRRGFDTTQATISRDIKELKLVKRAADGAYQRPGWDSVGPGPGNTSARRAVGEYLRAVERVEQLIVLKTDPGQAPPLALAIDRAGLGEVVGTIAGDDTVLVISRGPRQSRAAARLFEEWAKS